MLHEILQLERHRVVTLIGAGGKTTTMYMLAREMTKLGKKVLITTTTKIFYTQPDIERFVEAATYEEWLLRLEKCAIVGDFLVAGSGVKDEKILGVEPQWIDELAKKGIFDLILVEGDGSARKPLKAPADHEPVVPSSTTLLLPIMGLRVLNKPLHNDIVHRVQRFSAITGLKEEQPIRVEHYHRVFMGPQGYNLTKQKGLRKVVPIINQVDTAKREECAQKLAALFIKSGIEMVVLTSHRYENIVRRVCQ